MSADDTMTLSVLRYERGSGEYDVFSANRGTTPLYITREYWNDIRDAGYNLPPFGSLGHGSEETIEPPLGIRYEVTRSYGRPRRYMTGLASAGEDQPGEGARARRTQQAIAELGERVDALPAPTAALGAGGVAGVAAGAAPADSVSSPGRDAGDQEVLVPFMAKLRINMILPAGISLHGKQRLQQLDLSMLTNTEDDEDEKYAYFPINVSLVRHRHLTTTYALDRENAEQLFNMTAMWKIAEEAYKENYPRIRLPDGDNAGDDAVQARTNHIVETNIKLILGMLFKTTNRTRGGEAVLSLWDASNKDSAYSVTRFAWQKELVPPDGYIMSGVRGGTIAALRRELAELPSWPTIVDMDNGEFYSALAAVLGAADHDGNLPAQSWPVRPVVVDTIVRKEMQTRTREGTETGVGPTEYTHQAPDPLPDSQCMPALLYATALLRLAGRYKMLYENAPAGVDRDDAGWRGYEEVARSLAEVVVDYYDEDPVTYTVYVALGLTPHSGKQKPGCEGKSAALGKLKEVVDEDKPKKKKKETKKSPAQRAPTHRREGRRQGSRKRRSRRATDAYSDHYPGYGAYGAYPPSYAGYPPPYAGYHPGYGAWPAGYGAGHGGSRVHTRKKRTRRKRTTRGKRRSR